MHLPFEQEAFFPNLNRAEYRITSPPTAEYNCIAHAAGHADGWWWPVDADGVTWPDGIDKAETLASFVAAYSTKGYAICDSPHLESGAEKIAIYADENSTPTHAARQLPSGTWTSKLGELEDIEHATLEALEDTTSRGLGYGRVVIILKREAPLTP